MHRAWGLTVVLLAGCFGMCGYTPQSATWNEPGLFAWLEANGVAAGQRSGPGEAGLPFEGQVDGLRPQALRSLSWQREGDRDPLYFTLDAGGSVYTTQLPGHTEEDVRAGFRALAGNASAADPPALREAEAAFMANRSEEGTFVTEHNGTMEEAPVYRFWGTLPGPYRLAALFNETGATVPPESSPDPYREPGILFAVGGGYGWEFLVDRWTVTVEGGSIVVDLRDHVQVTGIFAEDDEDADVERKVRRAFAEAGLPEPGLTGMTHGGPIC